VRSSALNGDDKYTTYACRYPLSRRIEIHCDSDNQGNKQQSTLHARLLGNKSKHRVGTWLRCLFLLLAFSGLHLLLVSLQRTCQ